MCGCLSHVDISDVTLLQVITASMRCLIKMFKMPLPSLRTQIQAITSHLFLLVNQYAGARLAKGDNESLLATAFKALTTIVKAVEYHEISNEQLQVLLGYAEADMHDHMRQATAFNLLRVRQMQLAPPAAFHSCRLGFTGGDCTASDL